MREKYQWNKLEFVFGRILLASLFVAGALQKIIDPSAAQALLANVGLPGWLVWPAMVLNGVAAIFLLLGVQLIIVSRILAAYCLTTSIFHYVPGDPWQMSILLKNWALAGGFFVLAALANDS